MTGAPQAARASVEPLLTGDPPDGGGLVAGRDPVEPERPNGVLRGTSFNALGQVVQLAGVLVVTPYLLRHLGLERYGLVVLALTVVSVLGSFDGGVSASASRYLAVYAGRDDAAASARLLTTLALGVAGGGTVVVVALSLVARPLLGVFDVDPSLAGDAVLLLRVMAVVAVLTVLRGLLIGLLNAHQRYGAVSLVLTGANVFFYVSVLAVLSTGGGLRELAAVFLAQVLLSGLACVVASVPLLRGQRPSLLPRAELREFLSFAGRFQLVGLSTLVTLQTDAVVVGAATDVRNIGVYNVGANFSSQVRSVPVAALGPLLVALGNDFGTRGQQAVEGFASLQKRWVQGVTAWCAVALGAGWVGMHAWLGTGIGAAPTITLVLLSGNAVNLWTGALTAWLGVTGHAGVEARYAVVGAGLNVVLTAVLVVPFGAYGVAAATTAGQVVGSLYLLRLVARRVPDPVPSFLPDVPWLPGLLTVASVALLELAARPVLPSGPLGLLAAGVVAVPGFAVFAVLLLGPRQARTAAATGVRTVRLRLKGA